MSPDTTTKGPGRDRRFDLHEAFLGEEDQLRAALSTGRRVAGHPTVQGAGTETRWHAVLESVLPARYQVSPAIVVDSKGAQSHQIDLVIRDRHFSPLFWAWGGHLYVPAESVYAAFEVKPEINREYMLDAGEKVASVRALHRTSASFGWAMGIMPARELPPILGGILVGDSEWASAFGAAFRKALDELDRHTALDLGCVLGHGAFEVPHGKGSADIEVSDPDTALVSFSLTLLNRLQGLGSAPAIDYDAYAEWVASRSTGETA